MKKLFSTVLLFAHISLVAQTSNNPKKILPSDRFCDSLQFILRNSKDGFLNYRYNEQQGSVSLSYSTTLPALSFTKNLYKQV